MRKVVYLDENVKKTLNNLSELIQTELYVQFKVLELEGKLGYPYAKKIDQDLFEIRIKIKNIYRAFYAYVQTQHIVILHIFQKKTQKTPSKDIRLAKRRLKQYE